MSGVEMGHFCILTLSEVRDDLNTIGDFHEEVKNRAKKVGSNIQHLSRAGGKSLTKRNPTQQRELFAHQDLHKFLHFPPTQSSTFCRHLNLPLNLNQVIWAKFDASSEFRGIEDRYRPRTRLVNDTIPFQGLLQLRLNPTPLSTQQT